MIKDIKKDLSYKERLAAYLPIQPDTKYFYVPKIYREKDEKGAYYIPKSEWAVFEIEARNALHVAALQDEFVSNSNSPGLTVVNLMKRHIKGWKNWIVPFDEKKHQKDGHLSDEAIKLFRGELIEELFLAIQNSQELTEEELLGLS